MLPTRTDDGYTLIELMVVVTCIAVLAAIAAPRIGGYVLSAHLNGAKPYLMELAAKERMYKTETGKYCCATYTNNNEATLVSALGLSLAEAGDFCFVFVCNSSTICENAGSTGFVSAPQGSNPTPDFEVWAILRNANAASVTGSGGTTCTMAPGKALPTGWVQPAAATTSAGREGQMVVFRYAPPANGMDATLGTYHAVNFDWRDGLSTSDAMFP